MPLDVIGYRAIRRRVLAGKQDAGLLAFRNPNAAGDGNRVALKSCGP